MDSPHRVCSRLGECSGMTLAEGVRRSVGGSVRSSGRLAQALDLVELGRAGGGDSDLEIGLILRYRNAWPHMRPWLAHFGPDVSREDLCAPDRARVMDD